MFSFLNTALLAAAAAALIPLIIHLFSRRRVKVVEFSSVRHLKSMQRRQVRRLKIRQLLLLIVRMLIILFVVLAFARPTLKEGTVGAKASVSAVVLFDNSASMNRFTPDGNLFESAKKRTIELLQTLGPQDEVALLPLAGGTEPVIEYTTPAAALERLTYFEAGDDAADITAALEQASTLLDQAHNLNREIYIVSDRQRRSLPDSQILSDVNATTFVVDLPIEETENLGIIAMNFSGQLLQVGREFTLAATAKNYTQQRVTERLASLYVDGRRVAQSELTVEPGSETVVRFAHTVSTGGFHSGYVELSDDNYLPDNRFYFSFRIPEQFHVLVIDSDPSARFISLALTPSSMGNQYWTVKQARPAELSGVNFMEYDVVILAGIAELGESQSGRLVSYVERGKSLLVLFGENTNISIFNKQLSDVTGVTAIEDAPQQFSRSGFYSIMSMDRTHPVFSVFEFKDNKLPEVKFFALPKVTISRNVSTLMKFTGDRPAMVENQFGNGRVISFTGPLSPDYSDLFSHGFFVPFISRTTEYLASNLSEINTRSTVGQGLSRPLPAQAGVRVEVTRPDSSVLSVQTEESQGVSSIQLIPSEAGIYQVSSNGRQLDLFAVNGPVEEGDLAAADLEQFTSALGAINYRRLPYEGALAPVLAGFRIGRELWPFFIWAAVFLLFVEMILGHTKRIEEKP